MKTIIAGAVFGLFGFVVTEAVAQHAGCAAGGGTTGTTSSASTASGASLASPASAGRASTSGISTSAQAAANQLARLATQQQQQAAYQAALDEQEKLTAEEEQERVQVAAERKERMLAQVGTTFSARVADPQSKATGIVTYHTSQTGGVALTRLKVDVTGAPAYSVLSVSIGDTKVGEVVTDYKGAGMLILSSKPQATIQRPLPSDFPISVAAGASVSVGSMSGTWRRRSAT